MEKRHKKRLATTEAKYGTQGLSMPDLTEWLIWQSRAKLLINGAGERNRTSDLLITNQLLYRLSYSGVRQGSIKRRRLRKQKTTVSRQRIQCSCAALRRRIMTSTPSATVPDGSSGRVSMASSEALMSLSSPVSTL